jgi:FkbM family methyltransferase
VLLESLAGVSPGLTLDIGAFNGGDAIAYAAAGHRVHSFEPVPNKAEAITKLFAANVNAQRLTMNQVALANNSGEIQFTVNPGVGSLLDGIQTSNQAAIPGSKLVSVRVSTLDNELEKLEPNTEEIVFMKIDAQGHDGEVILGAKKLLAKHRIARLAFEVTPALSSVATYVEAFTFLHNVGYKCFDCGCQRNNNQRFWPNGINAPMQWTDLVQALNDDKFQFRGAHLGGWTNVVCLPQVL